MFKKLKKIFKTKNFCFVNFLNGQFFKLFEMEILLKVFAKAKEWNS